MCCHVSCLFCPTRICLLCCAVLCSAVLCCAMLCYAMLCCAMLCYAMLCYVALVPDAFAMRCYQCCSRICYVCYVLHCTGWYVMQTTGGASLLYERRWPLWCCWGVGWRGFPPPIYRILLSVVALSPTTAQISSRPFSRVFEPPACRSEHHTRGSGEQSHLSSSPSSHG